jgi:hypothetical protein
MTQQIFNKFFSFYPSQKIAQRKRKQLGREHEKSIPLGQIMQSKAHNLHLNFIKHFFCLFAQTAPALSFQQAL